MANNKTDFLKKARSLVDRAKRGIYVGSCVLGGVGAGTIGALALFTTVGSVLRYFFSRPILGDLEITEFVLAVIVACVLPYTQFKKGHVVLDLVMSRFSKRTQFVTGTVLYFFATGLTALITWQTFIQAMAQYRNDLISAALAVPVYPFLFVTAVGWGVLCLVFFVELVDALVRR